MEDRNVSHAELTALALPISTQYFLNNLIRVLRDDGLISQDQIRRAATSAMADLQKTEEPLQIRAALLLEPLSN